MGADAHVEDGVGTRFAEACVGVTGAKSCISSEIMSQTDAPRPVSLVFTDPGSFNGRTEDFESSNLGSNPSPGTSRPA